VKNTGNAPVNVQETGKVTRVGEPTSLGSWILHIGLIGVTDKLEMIGYNDMKKAVTKTWSGVNNGWVGITDKYWAATLIPDKAQPFTGRFTYASQGADVFEADYTDPAVSLAPGASTNATTRLFAGAKQVAVVDAYADQYNINLFDHLIDWGFLWFFTKPFFYLIDFFFHLFGNFGLAILATTVLAKLAFFPLANRSYRSMAAMRKIQPVLAELKERYKDDKVKQQQAQMELYKKEKVNPLAGCWPVALQIPVFFSLYSVLYVTIEMRQAPFFGWIKDLAAPDPTNIFNLFGLIPFNPTLVPIIGGALVIGVWPLLMGITMFVQMKLNPTPTTDPTQQMLFTYMPVLFTFMLGGFPAGLVIYWAWNNTLSATQQYVIMRRYGSKIDLLANIRNSFRSPSKQAALAASRSSAPTALPVPKAANDAGAPATSKGGKTKTKKPTRAAGAKGQAGL
jgi:YidC/Oxa1 family membrane protein insertase